MLHVLLKKTRNINVIILEVLVAISEFELFKTKASAKKFCTDKNQNLPPEQTYIDYKMVKQTLYFMEVHPKWDDPTTKTELLVAKFTYIKKDKHWKLYWLRQNMKWQQYEPKGINQHLAPLINIVNEDLQGFFWG
jgi:hypothetical protein